MNALVEHVHSRLHGRDPIFVELDRDDLPRWLRTTADEPDVLFLACSRPAMAFGVSFEGFMLNFCGTFLLGLWLGSPLYWLVGIALHFPMRIVTALDHNFFRLGRL